MNKVSRPFVRERETAMLSVYNQSYLAISIGEEVRIGPIGQLTETKTFRFPSLVCPNVGVPLKTSFQVREVRLHKLGPDSVTWSHTLLLQPGPGPLGLQVKTIVVTKPIG